MTFAQRIITIRKNMKLSQDKFGDIVNVSQRTVAFWESGQRMPSHSTISELADKLDVSVDYLLGRSDEAGRPKEKKPAAQSGELLEDIVVRLRDLPDPALSRVSDFLAGLQAGQEIAREAQAEPDPADGPAG